MLGFVGVGGVRVSQGSAGQERRAVCKPRRAVASSDGPSVAQDSDNKLGVLLLNLGGPERPEDVQPFLYNLFADPGIIRLPSALSPLQNFIANEISRSRAPKSRKAYESIGGGSPIVRITNQQADSLKRALKARDKDANVYVGMRYWHTFTEEAMDQVLADGVSKLVVLPLYPHFSISTTGSSLRVLDKIVSSDPNTWSPTKIDHTVIADWYSRPGYVEAIAAGIRGEIAKLDDEELKSTVVMFSAHGVPETYVLDAGDPYKKQIEECTKLVMEAVGSEYEWTLCFQSRVGPVKWLSPYTDDVIQELGDKGVDNLVVVPISFVSEHIETLEEIDIEYRELAHESGIKKFLRVPALDTTPAFIDDLADMTLEACEKPSLRINEALALKYPAGRDGASPDMKLGFGFNPAAEVLNGRLAMAALASLAVTNFVSSAGLVELLKLLR